jgi:hypothetical protein
MGVESLSTDELTIRLVARTLPGKQFEVGRLLRARVASSFRQAEIDLPAGLDTAAPTSVG